MEEAPERRRALAYLERKGTHESLPRLHAAVKQTFDQLEVLLAAIDATAAASRPASGGWTCLEIVDHLVESHRPAIEQLRLAQAGEDPGPAVPAGLLSADIGDEHWAERVVELAEVHDAILAVLGEAADDLTGFPIPVAMVVKAEASEDGSRAMLEWEEALDWKAYAAALRVHTLEHTAQIQRVRQAIEPGDRGAEA